jgi:DNA-binding NarL/FixJ family response regulator
MENQPHPLRILLVDDHAIFRQGLKLLLQGQRDLQVVAEATNARQALDLVAREQPHITLLDLDLEGTSSLDILESLQSLAPETRVIVLTGIRSKELQERALRLGARGFVTKENSADVIIRAIAKVRDGELWFDRATVGAAVGRMLHRQSDAEAAQAKLSPRELEIVRLVGEGLKNGEIAQRLFISEKTVRNHLTVIFDKIGVTDRLHLAIYAYRRGLARLPH